MVKKAITDAMCGKLSRWLRMIGIDTFYVRDPLFYILEELPLDWDILHHDKNCIRFRENNETHTICLIDGETYLDDEKVNICNVATENGKARISRMKINEDTAILQLSIMTGRVLLTIDEALAARAGVPALPWDFDAQLAKALTLLEAKPYPVESRCSKCNGVLLETGSNRWKCSRCGHEFWIGSHWLHISGVLDRISRMMQDSSKK
ncbi:MAG: Mut7-C RNAse domain-containing protein [Candidatus Korarchaeota archaeon]